MAGVYWYDTTCPDELIQMIMEILVRKISSNYIIFRTPTILMRKLGV